MVTNLAHCVSIAPRFTLRESAGPALLEGAQICIYLGSLEARSRRIRPFTLLSTMLGHTCSLAGVLLADGRFLQASLVVDASGRHSAAPDWLAAAGFPQPRVSHATAGCSYASTWVRLLLLLLLLMWLWWQLLGAVRLLLCMRALLYGGA